MIKLLGSIQTQDMIKLLGSIKHVASKSTPFLLPRNPNATTNSTNSYSSLLISPPTTTTNPSSLITAKDVVTSLKNWFRAPNTTLLDQIFTILKTQEQAAAASHDDASSRHVTDLALTKLNLNLTEALVLQVLSYGRSSSKDVLSCLQFFDWAGRQPGFHHTRSTFHAIFKILSKAKLVPLMLEFLKDFTGQHRYFHKVHRARFYDTLVLGYALAGKPVMALQLFGRMRFQGLDLDTFAYHVLLNALVDESCFDAVDMVAKQISMRGFENGITHNIIVKCLCKRDKLKEAEAYLRGLVESGKTVDGIGVSIIVSAHCKADKFKQASRLLEVFTELNVPMEHAYGVWLQYVVRRGRINWSLDYIHSKNLLNKDVPRLFQYNVLVLKLLREYRLNDVYDLLIEMEKEGVTPDKVTMNAVLCFFCKAGMVDVAIELYKSRSEFGLTVDRSTYNYLINNLCWNGGLDEAYIVLRNSIREGYFPDKRTFAILAGALCKEGKLDKIKELVVLSQQKKSRPYYDARDPFIVALCKANRVEDAYLLHGELSGINKEMSRETYCCLIYGFCKSNRGDLASKLLLEMQEKGHGASRNMLRKLFRSVICCLCNMQSPENQVFKLLEMQLSHFEPSRYIFNCFIAGAGYAKKPELAREVFEMMQRSGIKPNLRSDILMLSSYLKSDRISDALYFFNSARQRRRPGRKLYSSIVIGLCKAEKADDALNFMREMRCNNLIPSMNCYEYLIQLLCWQGSYSVAVNLVTELEKTRGYISSFIGNVLLVHSLKTKKLYEAWVHIREGHDGTSDISLLGQLIGIFSGCIEASQGIESLEEIISKCFPVDVYTYNTLLKKLSKSKVDHAFELFDWICDKGYEPNRWTYDIIINGLLRKGRRAEAQIWLEEMFEKGFDLTERTKLLI